MQDKGGNSKNTNSTPEEREFLDSYTRILAKGFPPAPLSSGLLFSFPSSLLSLLR